MAKISKPDANPIVALLLTLFVFELGHLIINGQQKKWIMVFVATLIGEVLCCLPGLLIFVLSVMDSYKTAQKLQAGKEVDENEYSVELLYKIVKIIHKDAIFVP
jgi:biotin transporter BioY